MTDSKVLVNEHGENLAVSSFLRFYGASSGNTSIKKMREYMTLSGFHGLWPNWVMKYNGNLSKRGAQHWIRYLMNLEIIIPSQDDLADITIEAGCWDCDSQMVAVRSVQAVIKNMKGDDAGCLPENWRSA